MTYNKRTAVLVSIIAALALIFAGSVFFAPERAGTRSAAYTWLDPKLSGQISGISITNPSGQDGDTSIDLVRKNNTWFVSYNGKDYPARQLRIEDLISALTKRAAYPVQTLNAAAHERLGLTENSALRLIVRGGAGISLLDLLAGQTDKTGRNIYLRRQAVNEVRSGENIFTAYLSSSRKSWYNLRLFPESESGQLDTAHIQRLVVYPSGDNGNPYIFTRSDKEWKVEGLAVANPDTNKINIYVHDILNLEGDDFDYTLDSDDPALGDSRVVLETGDGGIKTIRLSPPDDSGRRAADAGSSQVYSLPPWALNRIFRDAAYFEKDKNEEDN